MSAESAAAECVHGNRNFRDWSLFKPTVSSGAVDSIGFIGPGKAFTAFTTGDFAVLGLGIALFPNAPSVVSVLVSMVGFGLGICFARLIVLPRQTTPSRDEQATHFAGPPSAAYTLAASLLPHLVFVVLWIAAGASANHDNPLGLLALWAMATGMQSAAVRGVNVDGVFTTPRPQPSSCFLLEIPRTNRSRKKTGVLASLVVGAAAGGILVIQAPTYAPTFRSS